MDRKVIIMKGLPGSGKSTFARNLLSEHPYTFKRINRDELRMMFDNGITNRGNEKFIKKIRDILIMEALKDGKSVIVDDTNLSPRSHLRIEQLVLEYNKTFEQAVKVEIHEMETSITECIARDSERTNRVGEKVIRDMYRQFYSDENLYAQQDEQLPKAICCDLDGTLALLNGRDPYMAKACIKDILNKPVAHVLKSYKAMGYHIILLSGRFGTYRSETESWLKEHGIAYDLLVMRDEKDQRKDAIVKREFFEQYVLGKFYVEFILDDRNQVVNMWRDELKIPCFQVNFGDF